ncbi:MAG: hypothetical protein ABSD41_08755 [Candidatus Bathyarchaeia archaeon]
MTSTVKPWERDYRNDPTRRHLLSRNVTIAHHEDLYDAAHGFLESPFKESLGPLNTEALGVHHFAVHVKLGIARESLDELESKLNSNRFNLLVDPSFTFLKLLAGFFTNLHATFDNLAPQLGLVYDLGLSDRDDIQDILEIIGSSDKRVQNNKSLPHDRTIAPLVTVFEGAQAKIQEISTYRNALTHRKLPNGMVEASSSVAGLPLRWDELLAMPQATPTVSPFSLAPGAFVPLPSGSVVANTSSQQITVNLFDFVVSPPARFYLPKPEKLDLLPSQFNYPNDYNEYEITDVCEEFYRWTIDFLGRVYGVMVKDFAKLK